jgi:nitrate/nitrite transporter NarK
MSPIILGTLLMGWGGLSWQSALVFLGIVGVSYGVLFFALFRNTPAEHPGVNAAERLLIEGENVTTPTASRSILPTRIALKNRSLRWFVVQQFLDAGSDVAFVALIGTYFLQARGLEIGKSGWLTSLPLWGGALGGIVGGWLNDRLIAGTGNRRWSRSGVGFVGKCLGCLMLALMVQQTSAVGAALALMAAKFFSDWSQPTVWGTCTDLGGRFSATVFSIINTAGTLGGVVMPIVFGRVLDWFTAQATVDGELVAVTNWNPLFYLLAAMYLGSGVCWLMIDCTLALEPDETPDAS